MSLPPELDFQKDREASPARMNRAMDYIAAALRQALALKPEYEVAIAELRDVGLARLAAALLPVVERANLLAAELDAVHRKWGADNAIAIMKAEILAEFDRQFGGISKDLDRRIKLVDIDVAKVRAQIDALAVDSRIELINIDVAKVRAQLDAQAVDRWFFG